MPTKNDTQSRLKPDELQGRAAGDERSEPVGRRPAGGPAVDGLAEEVRDQLSDELIDELVAGARTQAEIVGPGGLLGDLTRRLVERAMSAELSGHLGL